MSLTPAPVQPDPASFPATISVAVCTCNGAAYLGAQLASIVAQSRRPSEIVIADDCSDDATQSIIAAFAAQSPCPVRYVRHASRLGVVGNFSHAIGLCSGDAIFLADQDDVWRHDKLAVMLQAIAVPGVQAVFSDAEVVAADLAPLGYTMWQRVGLDAAARTRMLADGALPVLVKRRIVMGAALGFRAELKAHVLPIPPLWQHDAWIALIAAAVGTVEPVPEPLLLYRQHGANEVGARRPSWTRQIADFLHVDRDRYYRDEVGCWRLLCERLASLPQHRTACLQAKLRHLETRAALPASRWRRLPGVLREIRSGGYARFARNWGSVGMDLLIR